MRTEHGPLQHLRVLELGSLIAGPFAGQLLGDYGAEVIKVEPPTGDPMRRWGVCHGDEGLWWTSIARNKSSVVLDLRSPEGPPPPVAWPSPPTWSSRTSAPARWSGGGWATTTWSPTTRG